MPLVPATKTPCTPTELLAALSWAYRQQLGHEADHGTLAVIAAQVALETANMRALVCWNIGNIKRGPGPDFCAFQTFEYVGNPPTRQTMTCQFSAWPDLNSSAAYFIHALYTNYPEAWTAAVHGDPEGFARGLKMRGYYTAPVDQYAAGVRAWFTTYSKLLGGDGSPTEPELSPAGDLAVLATTGLLDANDTPPDSAA